ncbi:MAG: diguanylate cyclase [Blastocatellia bacterium]
MTDTFRQKTGVYAVMVLCVTAVSASALYLLTGNLGLETALFSLPFILGSYWFIRSYQLKFREKDELTREVRAIHLKTIEALAKSVIARDHVAHNHLRRVQIYALGMARHCELTESETEALRAGALLFDVGKLAVPEYILNKPGKLTPAEYERMKIHTLVGEEIVGTIGFPYPVAPIVRHHHERWDGNGYPDRLKGPDTPIGARILSLVICYDALTNDQPYQRARARQEAVEILQGDAGKSFDPDLVTMFVTRLDEFEREILADKTGVVPELNTSSLRLPGAASGAAEQSYLERINSAHREFSTLYEMAHSFASSLDLDTALGIINEQLRRLIFFDTCVIYLTSPDGDSARVRYVDGPCSRLLENRTIRFGEGLTGWVLAHREHYYNSDPALDLPQPDQQDIRNQMAEDLNENGELRPFRNLYVFPLIREQEILGAVALYSFSDARYTPDHVRLIEMATPIASEAVNNAMRYARREEETMTDDLTGLGNSRAIPVMGKKEVERALQMGISLTVLMMDLDRFKRVNDTWGHRAGSQMLSELGPLIARTLRRSDFLARYGGDEFFALLPETNYEQARRVMARIEADVNQHCMPVGEDETVSVGISIGGAELGRDGITLEELIARADKEMYATKAEHKRQEAQRALAMPAIGPDLQSIDNISAVGGVH